MSSYIHQKVPNTAQCDSSELKAPPIRIWAPSIHAWALLANETPFREKGLIKHTNRTKVRSRRWRKPPSRRKPTKTAWSSSSLGSQRKRKSSRMEKVALLSMACPGVLIPFIDNHLNQWRSQVALLVLAEILAHWDGKRYQVPFLQSGNRLLPWIAFLSFAYFLLESCFDVAIVATVTAFGIPVCREWFAAVNAGELVEGLALYLVLMGIPLVHATAIRAVLFLPFAGGMFQSLSAGLAVIFSQIS